MLDLLQMENTTEVNRVRVLTFPNQPKATIKAIGITDTPCIIELDDPQICIRNPQGVKWVVVNHSELGDV